MNISKFNLKRFSTHKKEGIILPSGDYNGILKNSVHSKLKNNDDLLKLIWKIDGGEYNGNYFYSYFNLSKVDALKVLFIMIKNMGFDPEQIKYISELYETECRLIITLFNHKVHGKTNIVERYLPVTNSIKYKNIPCSPYVSTPFLLDQVKA